jgi:hypothetical protein
MKVAIDGADQPSTNDVLEQLIEVINYTFDFCKKVSVNMELMQSNAAQMVTYGIVIGIPQLLTIETATKSDCGRKFHLAMHADRKKYTYNHMPHAALLQIIFKGLAGADGVRVLKDAPALGAGTTHLVAKLVSYLQAMINKDIAFACTEKAYIVYSNSNSSKEEHKP